MPHNNLPDFNSKDYDYPLPDDLIAYRPAKNRDNSRLLVDFGEKIIDDFFNNIDQYLPDNALLVFNEARVIKARMIFQKESGATIEVFCLEPSNHRDPQLALSDMQSSSWNCLIGNARKWKDSPLSLQLNHNGLLLELTATKTDELANGHFSIRFNWNLPDVTFADILQIAGKMPLPPYIRRDADIRDELRYQTVYARNPGSVAAPTAGLHFTDALIQKLKSKGIDICRLTLHVGAGTFKPVAGSVSNHLMHTEMIEASPESIQLLASSQQRPWVAVGTTSLRALESLYHLAGLQQELPSTKIPSIPQWVKFQDNTNLSRSIAFEKLLKSNNDKTILLNTSLFIVPGKPIATADFLITNFHQPCSTLLMLVDAFASANWKRSYDHAIKSGYHFLSYGDACLFKNKNTPF